MNDLRNMAREGRSWSGKERNCFYLNLGGQLEASKGTSPQFANLSFVSGLDYPDDGRAVSLVDWDHDGDLDFWTRNRNAPRLRFFRNDLGSEAGQFLAIKLSGDGKTANRDAIGARVELLLKNQPAGQKLVRTLRAGESFVSQSSKWLHFGLGDQPGGLAIEKVVVRWPDAPGTKQTLTGLVAGKRYLVKQGAGWEELPPRDRNDLQIDNRRGDLAGSGASSTATKTLSVRVPAVDYLRAPLIEGKRLGNGEAFSAVLDGKNCGLVVLWASWCQPCLAELKELAEREQELREKGIGVIALSVDAMDPDSGASPEALVKLLRKLEFPFVVGLAEPRFVKGFQYIDDQLSRLREPLSVPSAMLIEPSHRVGVLYKGRLDIDQLLEDAADPQRNRQERWLRAAPLGGRSIPHPEIEKTAQAWQATTVYHRGRDHERAGQKEVAKFFYRKALEIWPQFPEARKRLLFSGEMLREP